MTEESEKEKKKERKLVIELDLDELDKPIERKTQQGCEIWQKDEDVSPEFQEFIENLKYLSKYLAVCVNEGPEVKDNIMKRMVALKLVIEEFFQNLNINGYLAYGMLFETLGDVYMNISGKQKTIGLLRQIFNRGEQLAKQKSEKYVS
jgi:hypothetical protein